MQLEIVKFRDALSVRDVTGFVEGAERPTIIIVGKDFSKAEKVLINQMESPAFQIVNSTTIHAVIPSGQEGDLRSLSVLSYEFSRIADRTHLSYEIGDQPKKLSGILALVQLYTKWLLQTPGSDIMNPQRGGGLQRIAGKLTSLNNMQPVLAELSRSIGDTTKQIQTAQIGAINLPVDERLLSADMLNSRVDENTQTVEIFVQVVSFAGSSAVAALSL